MVLSCNGTVYGREEAKALKEQDKIFGEGCHADVNSQTAFDDHTLFPAALNA